MVPVTGYSTVEMVPVTGYSTVEMVPVTGNYFNNINTSLVSFLI